MNRGLTRRSTRAADRAASEIKGSWPPLGYLGRFATPMADQQIKIGDIVRIAMLHDGLNTSRPETQSIYHDAFMRPLRVDGIYVKDGDVWVELNVKDDGSQAADWCVHTLCVLFDAIECVGDSETQ